MMQLTPAVNSPPLPFLGQIFHTTVLEVHHQPCLGSLQEDHRPPREPNRSCCAAIADVDAPDPDWPKQIEIGGVQNKEPSKSAIRRGNRGGGDREGQLSKTALRPESH